MKCNLAITHLSNVKKNKIKKPQINKHLKLIRIKDWNNFLVICQYYRGKLDNEPDELPLPVLQFIHQPSDNQT